MRKGSTNLGSLGVFSAQIAVLILPLYVASTTVLALARPVQAQESGKTASSAATASGEAQRQAVQRRVSWLQGPRMLAAQLHRNRKAEKQGQTVAKVINTRATWYGPGFHGRRTASGERFDRNAMTLASRHLPFGTRVRVVNPKTGRAAVARVNDRGPFRSGYTADLSQGLAQKIGLLGSGAVRLEILKTSR